MLTTNDLSKKEQRELRRWFTKIDEDTIELKIKWKGAFNLMLIALALLLPLYYDLIKPDSSERFREEIRFSFQPETRFKKEYNQIVSDTDSNMTMYGDTKEDFMKRMWERHKHRVWDGYLSLAWYVVVLAIILFPSGKRVRFDRKRGIIYTYTNRRLYLTEINKLMCPLPEYFISSNSFLFWIHPYSNKVRFSSLARHSRILFMDYSMYLPAIFGGFCINIHRKNRARYLKKYLVDFMNPNTSSERISAMMNALETKKGFIERLCSFLFGWIDEGLYTRRLPEKEKLEGLIAQYFKNDAPKIRALPSCRQHYPTEISKFKGAPLFKIISQDENRKAGFIKVPCPNLFEYPEVSMHKSEYVFDEELGNVKGKEL
ncbi:hypothetical protein NSA18_09070 [Pasteurella caecimuris]|uniref:hypothetical protein n=1 Tax=Rodentibacter caecimuris TaxID=1796644 RepID=UPI0021502E1D|nr:hypothetical protein [Pasteurella caecimuris]MCR1838031.1 hypothetical protein [Pasteurella caecimuris]MCU0107656.1 hypothetical protein [Pasteurella caecimuris]